ncbi:hypothetical protein FQR65_LT12276 [Abscondita terminalis]|nr:hypothetical protein FQR65_LT12276 [Abscondita terminalis]
MTVTKGRQQKYVHPDSSNPSDTESLHLPSASNSDVESENNFVINRHTEVLYMPTPRDFYYIRKSAGRRKQRRFINRTELQVLSEEDDEDGIIKLMDDYKSPFARILEDEHKFQKWNDFINMTEEDQKAMLDFVPNGRVHSSIKNKAPPKISSRIKHAMKLKKKLSTQMVEKLENEVIKFFQYCPEGVFVASPPTSFERLLLHAIAQYHRLSSISLVVITRSVKAVAAAPAMSDFEIQHKQPLVKKTTSIPIALYGGRNAVTMLPGGGIGPELMNYVKEIFKYSGAPVDFEVIEIDPKSDEKNDLEYAITSIKRNGVAIKGNIETKSESTGVQSRNVAIRNELDLYVNVLHCHSYPHVKARQSNIDILIIRQNTEGEYAMLEHESVSGVVESMKVVTQSNSERVARFAFEFARKNNRKKVTTIHKANIMKLSDGLFLETSRKVAKEYPEIEHNDMIIDNCCMQLVSNPHQFDVMIMTNLYGTIVSNVVCGLVGGAGLLSGRNYGDHYAIFEPGTRNTGTAIAGKNIANPIAMINSSIDMLDHLGHKQHSSIISGAVRKTICEDKLHTPDLGGSATSTEVVQRIIDHILQADLRAW